MNNKSFLGYKDNSPYRYNPFNIINTPEGLITMDGVSTPLIAFSELGERKYLPPNSGLHKFKGKKILEIPVMQDGGNADFNRLLQQFGVTPVSTKSPSDNTTQVIKTPSGPKVLATPSTPVLTPEQHNENIRRKKEADAREIQRRKDNIARSNSSKGFMEGARNSALGDKMRLFPNDPNSFIDEWINPLRWVGGMADNLGHTIGNPESTAKDYAFAVGTPLAGGLVGKFGARNTNQWANNLVNPFAGINIRPRRPFKSEIDWGKWNEEIPNNSELMKEYHAIEKASKADGTWMKNETLFKNEIANAQKEYDLLAKKHKELYDASQWKSESYYPEQLRNAEELKKLNPIIGDIEDKLNFYKHVTFTPEQFIQIQSENFKKAFPDGFDRIYRGVQKFDTDNIAKGSYREADNGNILFGTNKLSHARAYAKNGASGINLDHYFNAINQPGFLGPNSKIAEEAVEIMGDELLNPGVLDLVYDKNIQKQVIDAKGARWNELTGYGSTDDIAAKMKSGEIKEPIVQINNIHDGGDYFGNYKESMNTMIDPTKVRLKSLRHNNGMFDMTNPNIYKGIIPPSLLLYLQSQNQNNSGDTYRFGGKYLPYVSVKTTKKPFTNNVPLNNNSLRSYLNVMGSPLSYRYEPQGNLGYYQAGGDFIKDLSTSLATGFGLSKAHPAAETLYDIYGIWKSLKEGDGPKASINLVGSFIPGITGKSLEVATESIVPSTPDIEKRKMKFALNTRGSEILNVIKNYGREYWNNPKFLEKYKGKFQKGGTTNPPIYVTDLRDPRLQAYSDSLNLYKAYQFQKNNFAVPYQQWLNDVGKNYPGGPEALKQAREKNIGVPGTKISNEKTSEFKPIIPDSQYDPPYSGDNKIINYYKSLIGNDKNYRIGVHNSPDLWHKDIKSIGMYYDGAAESPIYKKPVQPYIYQKPLINTAPNKKTLTTKVSQKKIPSTAQLLNRERIETPDIIYTPQERLNIPLVRPYTVDYFDPELKQRTSRLFESDKEGAQFMKDLDPATGLPQYRNRGDYEVRGYYQQGGTIPCFKCGGLKKYQQAGTARTRIEDLTKQWPTISSLATDQPQQLTLNGPNPNPYLWTNFSLDGEQPVPQHPDNEAWKRDNALKQNTPPIPTDDKFPLRPIDAIIGANLGLRAWSSNMEHNRQKEAIFNNYQDDNFNPTFSRAFNDYGQNGLGMVKKGGFYFRPKNKFQDGGEFDPYEFLFGDEDEEQERLTESNIDEKSLELEQRELELQRQQEELEEAQNYALAMEQTEEDSPSRVRRKFEINDNEALSKGIEYRNYAMSLGLTKEEASGLIGNSFAESGFNPEAKGDNNTSIGLFQHHKERATALKEFAKKKGKNWQDPLTQIEFAVHELNTTHKSARGNYKDASSAALNIMNKFERPSEQAKRQSFAKREGMANTLMQFKEGGEYDLSISEINDLIARGYKIKTL